MKKYLILFFTTNFLSTLAYSNEFAIRRHLHDATQINQKRAILYAELTNNKSFPLSQELILMESLSKLITYKIDKKANKYMEKGIKLFDDDLVVMSFTPEFKTHFPKDERPTTRVEITMGPYSKSWKKAVDENDLDFVYSEALTLLNVGVLKHKNQNCLTRHFVESIARSIMNHELHRDKARLTSLEDPKPLLDKFLKIQIFGLKWASSLDRRAYPIQAKGVPLFCQDVPPIVYE